MLPVIAITIGVIYLIYFLYVGAMDATGKVHDPNENEE